MFKIIKDNTGVKIFAEDIMLLINNFKSVITASNQEPSSDILNQMASSLKTLIKKIDFTDNGTITDILLTNEFGVPEFSERPTDGMVIRFKPKFVRTGLVDINIGNNIIPIDFGEEVLQPDKLVSIVYDSSISRFRLMRTSNILTLEEISEKETLEENIEIFRTNVEGVETVMPSYKDILTEYDNRLLYLETEMNTFLNVTLPAFTQPTQVEVDELLTSFNSINSNIISMDNLKEEAKAILLDVKTKVDVWKSTSRKSNIPKMKLLYNSDFFLQQGVYSTIEDGTIFYVSIPSGLKVGKYLVANGPFTFSFYVYEGVRNGYFIYRNNGLIPYKDNITDEVDKITELLYGNRYLYVGITYGEFVRSVTLPISDDIGLYQSRVTNVVFLDNVILSAVTSYESINNIILAPKDDTSCYLTKPLNFYDGLNLDYSLSNRYIEHLRPSSEDDERFNLTAGVIDTVDGLYTDKLTDVRLTELSDLFTLVKSKRDILSDLLTYQKSVVLDDADKPILTLGSLLQLFDEIETLFIPKKLEVENIIYNYQKVESESTIINETALNEVNNVNRIRNGIDAINNVPLYIPSDNDVVIVNDTTIDSVIYDRVLNISTIKVAGTFTLGDYHLLTIDKLNIPSSAYQNINATMVNEITYSFPDEVKMENLRFVAIHLDVDSLLDGTTVTFSNATTTFTMVKITHDGNGTWYGKYDGISKVLDVDQFLLPDSTGDKVHVYFDDTTFFDIVTPFICEVGIQYVFKRIDTTSNYKYVGIKTEMISTLGEIADIIKLGEVIDKTVTGATVNTERILDSFIHSNNGDFYYDANKSNIVDSIKSRMLNIINLQTTDTELLNGMPLEEVVRLYNLDLESLHWDPIIMDVRAGTNTVEKDYNTMLDDFATTTSANMDIIRSRNNTNIDLANEININATSLSTRSNDYDILRDRILTLVNSEPELTVAPNKGYDFFLSNGSVIPLAGPIGFPLPRANPFSNIEFEISIQSDYLMYYFNALNVRSKINTPIIAETPSFSTTNLVNGFSPTLTYACTIGQTKYKTPFYTDKLNGDQTDIPLVVYQEPNRLTLPTGYNDVSNVLGINCNLEDIRTFNDTFVIRDDNDVDREMVLKGIRGTSYELEDDSIVYGNKNQGVGLRKLELSKKILMNYGFTKDASPTRSHIYLSSGFEYYVDNLFILLTKKEEHLFAFFIDGYSDYISNIRLSDDVNNNTTSYPIGVSLGTLFHQPFSSIRVTNNVIIGTELPKRLQEFFEFIPCEDITLDSNTKILTQDGEMIIFQSANGMTLLKDTLYSGLIMTFNGVEGFYIVPKIISTDYALIDDVDTHTVKMDVGDVNDILLVNVYIPVTPVADMKLHLYDKNDTLLIVDLHITSARERLISTYTKEEDTFWNEDRIFFANYYDSLPIYNATSAKYFISSDKSTIKRLSPNWDTNFVNGGFDERHYVSDIGLKNRKTDGFYESMKTVLHRPELNESIILTDSEAYYLMGNIENGILYVRTKFELPVNLNDVFHVKIDSGSYDMEFFGICMTGNDGYKILTNSVSFTSLTNVVKITVLDKMDFEIVDNPLIVGKPTLRTFHTTYKGYKHGVYQGFYDPDINAVVVDASLLKSTDCNESILVGIEDEFALSPTVEIRYADKTVSYEVGFSRNDVVSIVTYDLTNNYYKVNTYINARGKSINNHSEKNLRFDMYTKNQPYNDTYLHRGMGYVSGTGVLNKPLDRDFITTFDLDSNHQELTSGIILGKGQNRAVMKYGNNKYKQVVDNNLYDLPSEAFIGVSDKAIICGNKEILIHSAKEYRRLNFNK